MISRPMQNRLPVLLTDSALKRSLRLLSMVNEFCKRAKFGRQEFREELRFKRDAILKISSAIPDMKTWATRS